MWRDKRRCPLRTPWQRSRWCRFGSSQRLTSDVTPGTGGDNVTRGIKGWIPRQIIVSQAVLIFRGLLSLLGERIEHSYIQNGFSPKWTSIWSFRFSQQADITIDPVSYTHLTLPTKA